MLRIRAMFEGESVLWIATYYQLVDHFKLLNFHQPFVGFSLTPTSSSLPAIETSILKIHLHESENEAFIVTWSDALRVDVERK